MNERQALLAEIIANPADDGLRMIYADKLEEDATCEAMAARAEFIRCQVRKFELGELHRPSMVCDCHPCRLHRRAVELKMKHECVTGWFDDRIQVEDLQSPKWQNKLTFAYERGFISRVISETTDHAMLAMPSIILYEPVTYVHVNRPAMFTQLRKYLPSTFRSRNETELRNGVSTAIIEYARVIATFSASEVSNK